MVAKMPSIDMFCNRMRYWCDEGNLGYSQGDRWNITEGGNCDCSSLVIHCLQEAGFDTGGASYTGNMSSNLCDRGWCRVANDGNPQPGDILLNDSDHVAVWLGDCLAQASIDENGNISGGAGGDQSGWETNTRSYYDYPWNCYLRYSGDTDNGSYSSDSDDTCDWAFKYRSYADGRWWDECTNLDNPSHDGFSGCGCHPIRGIAIGVTAGSVKYRVHTHETGWLDWVEGYNVDDFDYGMAGDLEHDIDAVMVYWYSPDNNHYAKYMVATESGWYDWQYDTQTSNSQDGYAGDMSNAIYKFKLTMA